MAANRRTAFDDFRYIPAVAIVFVIVLRLMIGWQFLYEGLWKIDTLDTPQPWTSAGYLKSAHGPFRDLFRNMTGDPNDLHWLDEKWVAAEWESWAQRFTTHYRLNEEQQRRLRQLLDGPADFRAELAALPEGVAIPEKYANFVKFDPGLKRIIVDGKRHLTPAERDELLKLVTLPEDETDSNKAHWELIRAYEKAITDVYNRASRLSFKERLSVALGRSDPDRARFVFSNFKGTIGDKAPERIDEYYQNLLAAYEKRLEQANKSDLAFQHDHLAMEWQELQELRTELVGPVKALDAELKASATKLLAPSQIALGPPPEPWDQQRIVDWITIAALTVLGILLIAGLATRTAAIAGAGMVLSFYLVWPPWPGVPELIGPEHSFIVNKNLIEVGALLVIAALPTGQWFGLDRLIYAGWRRLRSAKTTSRPPAAPAEKKPAVATT